MRAGAAVSQQTTASFQISGSWVPGFWKMHWNRPHWTRYRHVQVCFSRDSRKGKGQLYNILCNDAEEVQMHIGSAILIIWLIIGGFAAGQRGDYNGPVNCSMASTAALTILAGPLNYVGVNPHINCTAPQPSN
jgi:hypothetical protein